MHYLSCVCQQWQHKFIKILSKLETSLCTGDASSGQTSLESKNSKGNIGNKTQPYNKHENIVKRMFSIILSAY